MPKNAKWRANQSKVTYGEVHVAHVELGLFASALTSLVVAWWRSITRGVTRSVTRSVIARSVAWCVTVVVRHIYR